MPMSSNGNVRKISLLVNMLGGKGFDDGRRESVGGMIELRARLKRSKRKKRALRKLLILMGHTKKRN